MDLGFFSFSFSGFLSSVSEYPGLHEPREKSLLSRASRGRRSQRSVGLRVAALFWPLYVVARRLPRWRQRLCRWPTRCLRLSYHLRGPLHRRGYRLLLGSRRLSGHCTPEGNRLPGQTSFTSLLRKHGWLDGWSAHLVHSPVLDSRLTTFHIF